MSDGMTDAYNPINTGGSMDEQSYTNYGGEFPVYFVEAVYDLSEYRQMEIPITVPTKE